MPEIVLIHGAFQGGWVWQDTAAMLRSANCIVHTPTLSGCGARQHPGASAPGLVQWADEIATFCRMHVRGPATLVAHSYSGLPCALALQRNPDLFQQIIFTDAMLPEAGQSFADVAGPEFQKILQAHQREDGLVAPWPAPMFGLTAEEWPQFRPQLQMFPASAFTTPYPETFQPPESFPCAYIACSKTPAPFIRRMANLARERGWLCCTVESSHCPMVSNPKDLAATISTLVKNWSCW